MEYKFSERVLTLKPSAIREIFKYAADPTYISLSAGNPAPEAFPVKPLAEISAKLMAENPILALQYSTTEGYTPLRDHLRAKGYDLTYEESPGDHQWKYWDEKIQTVLSWLPISKAAKN